MRTSGRRRRAAWTERERDLLRYYWGCFEVKVIADKLHRTLKGVVDEAVRLYLPRRVPGARPLPPSQAMIRLAEYDDVTKRALDRRIAEREGTYIHVEATSAKPQQSAKWWREYRRQQKRARERAAGNADPGMAEEKSSEGGEHISKARKSKKA